MQTFTLFLLAAAAVGAFARSSGSYLETNEMPPLESESKNPKSPYYKKQPVSLNSIEIGQQMGKKYPDYIDSEATTFSSIPVDDRGNVWISDSMRTSPNSYLEIPWLDQKLYKNVKIDKELSSTLMRAIIDNSYKKYGFKIKLNGPTSEEVEEEEEEEEEKDPIAEANKGLNGVGKTIARLGEESLKYINETKKNEKRKQEMDLRETRQGFVSKTKALVADDLNTLKNGLNENSKPQYTVYDSLPTDPANTLYGAALITVFVAAATMAVIAFAYGWYSLVKRAKAAAAVEYPAYGVTGPTSEGSGDRRLAHSAHMYHYQHQKQQIIALEKLNEADEAGQILSPEKLLSCQLNGLETSNGSISDPDSEEDRAEGDYTVYECPGFATTGDMEVKNPMFTEDPTPATPGKCELVHPQPKE